MLYNKSKKDQLEQSLFQNPTSEYRGTPFWAWNCKLKEDQLLRQIGQLQEMGMGGFHIHCRVGLDTEYLGEEFFKLVKSCNEEAKKREMLCWLYDEDRWPSGSAGGIVTKEEKYRSRFMVFVPADYKEEEEEEAYMAAAKAIRSKNKNYLAKYRVILDEEGYLISYDRVAEDTPVDETIWEAYLEISGSTPWFNNEAYVNTLDKAAINRFIETTYEKYYEELKEDFGTSVPSFFTDEPQTSHKEVLRTPSERKPIILPFTDDFDATFKAEYNSSILDHLPELIWEKKGEVSSIRYHYHCHVCERFSEAFCDNVGKWCEDHEIHLTGHMMSEWTLYSQTLTMGEAMRPMKEFGLPGIDMLCDRRELSTAKQATSVAHQFAREGVMSEIYGVTSWAFDFRNHKIAGDWQAALGITVRVPHLSWVSMEGEGKRDYPASIGYQSPWYKEYSYIEDHFARLNTALTRGNPHVRVGVIHPIESYWLYWGNQKQTSVIRQELEENFTKIIDWLLYGLIDFDFISESLLAEDKTKSEGKKFVMGAMNYEVVLVPGCHTIRESTLDKLEAFANQGGQVIFAGDIPKYVDAKESNRALELADRCKKVPYSYSQILDALEDYRDVDILVEAVDGEDHTKIKHVEEGVRANNLFYQMREDKEDRWLFICHVNKMENEHIAHTEKWRISIEGEWEPVAYDTLTGEIHGIKATYEQGKTIIEHYCSQHDSLLLSLKKRGTGVKYEFKGEFKKSGMKSYLPSPDSYTLEEPNVFLLDMGEYAFDDEAYESQEELLRIDNLFRRKLGYPLRMEALAQPWTNQSKEEINHVLHLKFTIESEIEVKDALLAMENPQNVQITVNNQAVTNDITGWYVDEAIQTLALPTLRKGTNIIILDIPFGPKTNVEWCYLLGSFGVDVRGKEKKIIALPEVIHYGNFVHQGLPFYAGNLTYHTYLECEEGELHIETSHYRGALVQAFVDGEKKGNIVLAPYVLNCGKVSQGKHKVSIKIFGNRINAFGAVHNADASESWYGPNIWRTTDNKWSYEYQLQEMGVLTTPRYWIAK